MIFYICQRYLWLILQWESGLIKRFDINKHSNNQNMIRQNKAQIQKIIMFSKEISTLPSSIQANNELIIQDEDAVYPRVFPNPKIPLKVAIMRKMKAFEQYQIDQILKKVDWKYNNGLLELKNYNFTVDVILHQCTQKRLNKGSIKGRALHPKSMCFKQFIVTGIKNEQVLMGYFIDNPKEEIQISKFYVCLSFQNPQKYARIILQSLENRQNFLSMARYSFYIDNMDLQQSPELPKSILNAITSMIGVQFLNRQQFKEVSNHYKRTMNEILFEHSVLNGGIDNILPVVFRQKRKLKEYTPKSKSITLMKDGKKFKLTLKSLKKKIQQIQAKTIFFKDQIISLTHSIKIKILSIYNYQIFDLKEELFVLDRFVADNMLMVGYFVHFLDEKVIGHIADMIRKQLIQQPQGWFKVYDGDRNSYLLTKLRRFFIFVEQNIKNVVKTHIQAEIQRYSEVLRKRLPIGIKFDSFRKFKLQFKHTKRKDVTYCSLIIISCNIGVNNFEMTIKRDKIQQNLLKNLKSIFKKIEKINSPQNKALRQIYAMFKDQFGIQIQLPIEEEINVRQSTSISINEYQNTWISKQYSQLKKIIGQSIQTLKVIQDKLKQISNQINLKQILSEDHFNTNMNEVIAKIDHFQALYLRIDDYFPGLGVEYGLFFIDYKPAKDQLKQLLQRKISNNKSFIMSEYKSNSQRIETQLENLLNEIYQKPENIYELVEQRQKLDVLQQTVEGFDQRYEKYLYSLCEDYSCFFSRDDNQRRWTNTKKISQAFEARKIKGKQYNQIKKGIVETISKQKQEIIDVLNLFEITLHNIRISANRNIYQQNFQKLQHLNGQYLSVKKMIQDIRYKQQHLILPAQDFQLFQKIEEPFLLLHTLWDAVSKWELNRQIWYNRPFSQFQINKPEIIIHEMLNSIKKIEKKTKQFFSSDLFTLIITIKKQIQFFEITHLRLLKLLKKEGFSKKHLQKIGLYIKCELNNLTLQQALELNFLQAIEQIQAVSNDAWNEYYLQQTLTRVQTQLSQMKYEIIYYLDKKGNQIPLVNNYSLLDQRIEQIILDLEAVQFNPMKGHFQNRINQLLQKSIYITKSLEKCQIFQKKFVQLHPIFDSTDVVKQLPVQNRLFTKLLRSWVQLLKYFKKIVSVYDSCNGQNIAQKMSFMINNIENVKVGLANYLQRKRQGFNRFYLLTDQQLYELFASTNDMRILSKHISKLFHSITDLIFDDEYIEIVVGINTSLKLRNKVLYKKQNLQEWLNLLERSIKQTLFYHFQVLMKSKNKWMNLLNYQCSQILLMCYEIEKTQQILSMEDLKKTEQSERIFIRKLVDIKNNRPLTIGQSINLGSLLVLALYLSQKVSFLRANNISDVENFQIKKMMKVIIKDEQISIVSFQTKIGYGFEYLGLVKRLVLTNLTERMQLIYMSAIKYSLGGSAIGPAGTGKSQTTKDIARICGKNCIIYNCSQSLTIDTIIRILKGMVVTGLWICLDQFNRLHYQVLNMISEQLSIIFKYKAMGVKLEVEYDRQVVNFKPDYHLCIAYNPTYADRQTIPHHVLKQFRIVALVKCDKKMICKLLFYSKGFKEADSLSEKLNKIFDYCEHLWSDYHLYDFGLRTLISIIELSGIMFKGAGKGDSEVNEAIKILVFPRLSQNHKKILTTYSQKILQQSNFQRMQNSIQSKANQISNILSVRLGIIILGDIFSNKTSAMKCFQNLYKEYKIQQIYINTLTIDQIYGQTNKTTRIFKDGYLTKKIRQYLSSKMEKKLIVFIKGVIFSQWIENLNSVLDNTRSLSLPSGEILWIPQSIKFILSTSHLDYASPATISRSCVMSYRAKTARQLIRAQQHQTIIKDKLYDKFDELYNKLKTHMLYDVQGRIIIHWINRFLLKGKLELSRESFMHCLSLIYSGLLDEAGRIIFDQIMKLYLQINESIFDLYWDGKTWKKISQFCISSIPNKLNNHQPSSIIIKNQKYNRIYFINKTYFMGKGSLEDILLLIGNQNIGKSSITSFIYSQFDKKLVQFKKINLTQRIESEQLHSQLVSMLHKKSNKRKGMIHGKEMFVLLDDIHLPQKNRYEFTDILEFFNLMISKKGCYNYSNLEFQFIDQLYLIANNNLSHKKLNVGKEFLKHSLPIFVKQYKVQQIQYIFQQIIGKHINVEIQKNYFSSICHTLVSIILQLKQQVNKIVPKYFQFQFFHFHKILLNSLRWNISQITDKKNIIDSVIVFELERVILSRIHNLDQIQNIKGVIRKHFGQQENFALLFHSFQKGQNGTSINPGTCSKVVNFDDFLRQIQYICDQYVLASEHPQSSLVVFPELCILLCRITRGLSITQGHISLVGLPKCGKKMIVNLCNYLLRSKIYRIPEKYDQKAWYQSIRMCSKQSLQNKCPSILLIQQHQLKNSSQKQQLNTLLKSVLLQQVLTQADYEQLIYLFQNQLIRKHLAVNKQNTILLFKEYLNTNLHIVILMNPMLRDFKENMISYPALSKYCQFYWIVDWPSEALVMIAQQAVVENQLQPFLRVFPQLHQASKQKSISSTKVPHWQGLYLDFLKIFQRIYSQNNHDLVHQQSIFRKSFAIIKQTQLKLEATRDQIKKLQPAILILQKQTIKTIKSLNIQKANAQTVNEQLVKKQAECSRVIGQANAVKIKLQITNKRVEQELKKAWENVYLVKQTHISEIKSLMNPSEFIKIVITAIVIILNDGQFQIIRNRSEDGLSYEQSYFQTGKRYILSKDSKVITKMLTQYNKQRLNKQKITLIEEKCLKHPRWNIIEAKSANKAVFYFFLWVEAVVQYFKLYQQTIPMRQQLIKTTQLFQQKSKEVQIVKKELGVYQRKIKELTQAHKEKTQKLTEYTNQIKLYEKMLNRGYEILKQIQTEKSKWTKYENEIQQKFKENFGNSIMSSFMITYASPHTKQIRNSLVQQAINIIQAHSIQLNNERIYWMMKNQQQIILKQMGIYEDQYILNNLKIVEKTEKICFLIDPQEEGFKYIKMRYKNKGVMFVQKIDYHHKLFRKTLERAIIDGLVIFIEITGDNLPYLIEFLLNPKIHKNESNGNTEILFDQKYLFLHPSFKAYLFTTSSNSSFQKFSIDLISKVTTVNFSITGQQLQQKLIDIAISIQYPEQNEQLEEINKINIKDNIELSSIENKILSIFANMENPQDILKTEEILQILSTSNRLYKQIQTRIQDSNSKRKVLRARRQHFTKKAQKTSKLYFQLQKMSVLSLYYRYSFNWFINLFKESVNNFNDNLWRELSKGLPGQMKIIAPLLIAQIQFPKIPFWKLFNQKSEQTNYVLDRYRLNVSRMRLGRIVENIRLSGIDFLDRMVKDYPEKFEALLRANQEDVLGGIPDEFSQLQFFDKIILVNCFRPDCTLQLLGDWFNLNLGVQTKLDSFKLLSNIPHNRPILVLEGSHSSSPLFISKIFDSLYRHTGRALCYINCNNCSLARVQLLLQSGFDNDQWVVMEGLGENSAEINELVISLMQDGDYKRKDIFRLWMVVNEVELSNLREKLVKLSTKIVFEEGTQLLKKVSNAFTELVDQIGDVQVNKKKYMLHQLCLLHYMLSEKSRYRQKMWNTPIIFLQDDLIVSTKYLQLSTPQQLKKLYPSILTDIVYGGKITDQLDVETISLHAQQCINALIIDKGAFWQTVWADEKFPKSQLQYEAYLRTVISKPLPIFKNLHEQYGINTFVINFTRQNQYQSITRFYNNAAINADSQSVISRLAPLLRSFQLSLTKSQSFFGNSLPPNQSNPFYAFLIDQHEYIHSRMKCILQEIRKYLQLEDLSGSQMKWALSIIADQVPISWQISTIRSLSSWLAVFQQSFREQQGICNDDWGLSQSQIPVRALTRVYQLQLIHHFPSFCEQLFQILKGRAQTHYLCWQPLRSQRQFEGGIRVQRWYIWNAIFSDEYFKPLQEGTMQLNYYFPLPQGHLTIVNRQKISLLPHFQPLPLYKNSIQYGNNPVPLLWLHLPIQKLADKTWTKRSRSHLTLYL